MELIKGRQINFVGSFVGYVRRCVKYRTCYLKIKAMPLFCLTKLNNAIPYFCLMKPSSCFLLILLSFFFIGCNNGDENNNTDVSNAPSVPSISYSITGSFPHDTSYFTEGLEFHNNTLLESTGLNGQSRLVRTDLQSGKVLQEVQLDRKYFGEGITVLRDTLYQLTYRENLVFVYSANDFKKLGELPLTGEGWGLTNDGNHLIASNGSSDLFFYDPSTFKLLKTLTVRENGSFVPNINELEYVNGVVYANQWQSNNIFRIDLQTGNVVGKMNLSEIAAKEKAINSRSEVLNGIAYNPSTKKLYITGKNWSRIYEIQVAP